jgi:hypothetical protein
MMCLIEVDDTMTSWQVVTWKRNELCVWRLSVVQLSSLHPQAVSEA